MTAKELIQKFNDDFGTGFWPQVYEVDAETYGHCCQAAFNLAPSQDVEFKFGRVYEVALGHHRGLMFKYVELILKEN